MGIGDRFARQGEAQLQAFVQAAQSGIPVHPVWNKSHREHTTVRSKPSSVRVEADQAVRALAWSAPYYVDADHINLNTVDAFIECSDFFTLDVADAIDTSSEPEAVEQFLARYSGLCGSLSLPGLPEPVLVTQEHLRSCAQRYLAAVQQAASIYERIVAQRSDDQYVIEVSMDETDTPQQPADLLCILAMIGDAGIPIQTIAPKFSGRFNKGVDYRGDLEIFAREFECDIAVLRYAISEFSLPASLKLSVHSGSDKFSLYPIINRLIRKHDVGIHLKTAGTTWLEEVIGLAESGGDALACVKKLYARSYEAVDALTKPYQSVVDIDKDALPAPEVIQAWSADELAVVIRHEPKHPAFNTNVRQLLHVGYKLAAQLGEEYLALLEANRDVVARNVTYNLLERHIRPIFSDVK